MEVSGGEKLAGQINAYAIKNRMTFKEAALKVEGTLSRTEAEARANMSMAQDCLTTSDTQIRLCYNNEAKVSDKIYLFKWRDSAFLPKWVDFDQEPPPTACKCETVGWIVHETDEDIVVAGCRNDNEVGNIMVIPKACIHLQLELKVAEDEDG